MKDAIKSTLLLIMTTIFVALPSLFAVSIMLNWNFKIVLVIIILNTIEVAILTVGLAMSILKQCSSEENKQ